MSLVIRQTHAEIGIERIPGRLEIHTQSARLEFRQKHAKVNIQTELPRIEIDQYEAFASAGLKNHLDLTKEAARIGYQRLMEYIGKAAADGDRLAAIELGGSPLADIAERDAYPEHESGYGYIPESGLKISVSGSVRFEPETNDEGVHDGVEGNYIPGDIRFGFIPATVNIYMRQYNSISFSFKGKNVDVYL